MRRVQDFLKSAGILLVAMTTACGASTNLNQVWGGNDDAADTLVQSARVAYDQGNFSEAQDLAEKAVDRNAENEEAAVLLGYIHLSLGGIDPYRLARALIALSPTKKPEGTKLTQGEGGEPKSDNEDSATDTLSSLSSLINLSEADFKKLQMNTYQPQSELFTNIPIIVPANVTPELRASVEVLDRMTKAMTVICRFVDASVKIEADVRHKCEPTRIARKSSAKAHFLWAFSHLTESIVYQSVLLYSTKDTAGSGAKSNFAAASQQLDQFKGDIDAFSKQVADMKGAVDAVFDTTTDNSMVAATLNDLEAVNRAFAALDGLPKNITAKISEAMEKINKIGQQVGSDDKVLGNSKALKGQMTEKFGKVVGGKIDKVLTAKFDGPVTVAKVKGMGYPPNEEKALVESITKMCASYVGLMAGSDPALIAKNQPESCK